MNNIQPFNFPQFSITLKQIKDSEVYAVLKDGEAIAKCRPESHTKEALKAEAERIYGKLAAPENLAKEDKPCFFDESDRPIETIAEATEHLKHSKDVYSDCPENSPVVQDLLSNFDGYQIEITTTPEGCYFRYVAAQLFNSILQCAADSPEELRVSDVDRVMSEAYERNDYQSGIFAGFKEWILAQNLHSKVKKAILEWEPDEGDDNDEPAPNTPNDDPSLSTSGNPGNLDGNSPYYFSDFSHLRPGVGAKTKLNYNKTALKVLRSLKAENRQPTAEERDKLAKYVGNGSIAQAIDSEYLELTADPNASLETDNAFQTSPDVIKAIWQVLEGLGFTHGRILDPSCNIGNFIGLQPPEHRSRSEWALVEINPDAAAIAQYLHPDAILYNRGYEESPLPKEGFDLVISNFPFSQVRPFDPEYSDIEGLNLHNYFFLKSLDLIRVGGLIAALTSTSTLDNPNFCRLMEERGAYLIGAARLPKTAFRSMGTQVITDLIIFKKLPYPELGQRFAGGNRETNVQAQDGSFLEINEYFYKNPQQVLGTLTTAHTLYGGKTIGVEADDRPIDKAILEAFPPLSFYKPEARPKSLKSALLPSELIGLDPYSFLEQDSKIYQYRPGEGLILVTEHSERIRAGLELKKVLNRLIELEVSDAEEGAIAHQRNLLNSAYDEFTQQYGCLLDPWKQTKKIFADDSELYSMLFALEEEHEIEVESGISGKSSAELELLELEELQSLAGDFGVSIGDRSGKAYGKKKLINLLGPKTRTEYRKAEIFSRRISGKLRRDANKIETAQDALFYSLNNTGSINLDLIASLISRTPDEVILELNSADTPQVFYCPQSKKWQLYSEYLSGDTRTKLALVKAIEATDAELYSSKFLHYNKQELGKQDNEGRYININPYLLPPCAANTRAELATRLKKEQDIDSELSSKLFIVAGLGTPWLETDHIAEFTAHIVGCDAIDIKVDYASGLALWGVAPRYSSIKDRAQKSEYSTAERNAIDLIQLALNQQKVQVDIYTKIDGNNVKDKEASEKATNAAIAQQDRIKAAFVKWLWGSGDRAWHYTQKYNRLFPRPRKRDYSAPWLTLPNSSTSIELRPHQKAAVNRILQDNSTLLLHQVGCGKTLCFIAASYEAKRLGKCNKPMIVVLKSTLSQIVGAYKALYPNARLLIVDGDDKNKTFVKIQTGNYDAIILTHDQFYSLPVSTKTKLAYIQEQLDLVSEYLDGADKGDRLLKRELESYQTSLEDEIDRITTLDTLEDLADQPDKLKEYLSDLLEKEVIGVDDKGKVKYLKRRAPKGAKEQKLEDKRRDRLTSSVNRAMHHYTQHTVKSLKWEKLGIDFISFDECHALKNIRVATRIFGVSGVQMPDTQRTLNCLLKFRHTAEQGGKIIGATGTMPTNTVAELYVMQRFFVPDELDRVGLKHFDSWIGQFAEARTSLEFTSTGGIKTKTRINRFKNLLQLMDMQRSFTDFITADQINIPRPIAHHTTITAEPNEDQLEVMAKIADYMKMWQSGKDKGAKYFSSTQGRTVEHNPLTLTNMGSQNAIDPRLVEPKAGNHPESKINKVVHNAYWIWQASESISGTQLIFCDTGTPNGQKDRFNVYAYVRDALIALGVPAQQIAFIHDFEGKKRQQLFDAINDGKIRFLLGSTEKAGTGVNVQRLCIALHHIDMSWTPAKQEQRNGRGHRQGNLNSNVFIFYYGTSGKGNAPGFDAYKSKLVSDKAAFIYQIMSDNVTDCVAEDVGDDAAMYMMAAVILSGNGQALEHAKLSDKIRRIEADLEEQANRLSRGTYRLSQLDDWIKSEETKLEAAIADQKAAKAIGSLTGDSFRITLVDNVFTKFGEAEEVLKGEIAKYSKSPGTYAIGKIGAFTISLNVHVRFISIDLIGELSKVSYYGKYETRTATLHGIRNEIGAIAEGFVSNRFKAQLDEYQHDKNVLPRQVETLKTQVGELSTQLAPLREEEAKLRAQLQTEIKEEGEPRKLPSDKELVQAPTPAPYAGVEPEVIEYLRNLPEPTAQDADGNVISWIPQMREQCRLLALKLAGVEEIREQLEQTVQIEPTAEEVAESTHPEVVETVEPAPQPAPQPKQTESVTEATQPQPVETRKRATREQKKPRSTVAKFPRPGKTPRQHKTDNVVQFPSIKAITPATGKDIKKSLKAIEKSVRKNLEPHARDTGSVERVVAATIEATKREMGLVVEMDGYVWEDVATSGRGAIGQLQGKLF